MHRYQFRRRIEGDPWIDCDEAKARNLLAPGYFDVDIPVEYMDQGLTAYTQTHEVRINPKQLIIQRETPTPDETGDILFA